MSPINDNLKAIFCNRSFKVINYNNNFYTRTQYILNVQKYLFIA